MEYSTKILVVEDDAAIRRILEYQLQKAGYQVLTAEDGETGLLMAREHSPDLVLLDVLLFLPIRQRIICLILVSVKTRAVRVLLVPGYGID